MEIYAFLQRMKICNTYKTGKTWFYDAHFAEVKGNASSGQRFLVRSCAAEGSYIGIPDFELFVCSKYIMFTINHIHGRIFITEVPDSKTSRAT